MSITREELNKLQSFETEEMYRASPSLNYSTLKDVENGPWCLVSDRVFTPGKAFEVGDYVDKYFTNRDLLEELYEIAKPKIELSESLETLYRAFVEDKVYYPNNVNIIDMVRELRLWSSIKDDEKILSRITDDFHVKLQQTEFDSGKIQMTADQHLQALNSINNICNNVKAIELITEENGNDEEVILIPQFKWEFELTINGHKRSFRVMYDWLKFNITTKKIIGIDLKTGAKPSHKFGEQFLDYRYDVQGILYYFGLLALLKTHFPEWTKCTPEDFKFLYTPKIANREPIIVPLTERFIRQNENYIYNKSDKMYGIAKLIDDADWYIENQCFDRHRLLAENDGVLKIDQLL